MRGLAAVIVMAACGHPAAPLPPAPFVRRLPSPATIDPNARGAGYLTSVAVQLQPGWGQFLDDCRLRLPASHPLNQMALAAIAEITVDRRGKVVGIELAGSGNRDFDRAVREAISDASPLAVPPQDLISDDDQLHLRWLFARDRRQAGPATAEIVTVELPLATVIDRLIGTGELARAAGRIAGARDPDRSAAIERLMIAVLRESLASTDGSVRRAAVEAIGRARVQALAPEVRALLTATSDTELRLTAIAAAANLGDRDAATVLLQQLSADLAEHPRLALAETRALATLGQVAAAARVIRTMLEADRAAPAAIAIQALALAPVPELAPRLAEWFTRGDARTRAAACVAAAGAPWVERGLRDRDATVRATCARSVAGTTPSNTVVARLHELARDRDRTVRAAAVAALVRVDPGHLVRAADDPGAEVRASFATALAAAPPAEAEADLRTLIDDRDPDVRAAAWTTLAGAAVAAAGRSELAVRAVRDSAPQVRRAAVLAIDDDDLLLRLASSDDAPDVRTAALVQLAARRGRDAVAELLLERLAAGPRGASDRARIALAWLLAR